MSSPHKTKPISSNYNIWKPQTPQNKVDLEALKLKYSIKKHVKSFALTERNLSSKNKEEDRVSFINRMNVKYKINHTQSLVESERLIDLNKINISPMISSENP